jgi:hypothetical protein
MTSTFAIDVIQTLNPQEAEDFKLFLASPYFRKGYNTEGVIILFETLSRAIQGGQIGTVEKEDIHQVLFPEKPYIESKIDKLMSELKRLLERFLLAQRYLSDQNEDIQLLDLTKEMRLRGLESRYQQSIEKVKKHVDIERQDSLKSLFFRLRVAIEEQEWHSTYNRVRGDLNIPETIQSLDNYYFAYKTWMFNQFMFMKRATSLSGPAENIGENAWQVPDSAVISSAFLKICWKVNLLLKKHPPKIEDFQSLLLDIRSNEHKLSSESLSEFYAYLRNFCVILIDHGHTQIHAVLHEINQDNLERGYFYLEGKISPNACLSITQTAISVGDVTWATKFIEAHEGKIMDENETKDFYRMNKALCLFGEKKYEQALDIIPFGSTYSFYHLMARRLELKIYYELRSDLLDHKIDAFKMFISRAGRKVFSQNLHELFTNFVNFVRQLNQSDGPQAKHRSQTLIKRISEKEMVAERLWLLEKAKELGTKK